MNKEGKLKKLKMKYFWKQKLNEVGFVVLGGGGFIFIPYWVGRLTLLLLPDELLKDDLIELITWFVGFIALAILTFVVCIIWCWIGNNLEKAEEKARNELKMTKKK